MADQQKEMAANRSRIVYLAFLSSLSLFLKSNDLAFLYSNEIETADLIVFIITATLNRNHDKQLEQKIYATFFFLF